MTMGDAMRITPLDIQQMVFKVSFRGYDKEDVNRFLEELAQTVETMRFNEKRSYFWNSSSPS
jgi:cell division initiation protein